MIVRGQARAARRLPWFSRAGGEVGSTAGQMSPTGWGARLLAEGRLDQ